MHRKPKFRVAWQMMDSNRVSDPVTLDAALELISDCNFNGIKTQLLVEAPCRTDGNISVLDMDALKKLDEQN